MPKWQGLDLPDVLVEVEKRGSSFDELLAVPEQDDWIYSDGKSTSCIAFILEMYKEAGLFDPISSSIQVTEFTVRTNLYTPKKIYTHTKHIHTLTSKITFYRSKMLTCSSFSRIMQAVFPNGAMTMMM